MIQLIWTTLGIKPTILIADTGYFSYNDLELLDTEEIDTYIPDNYFEIENRGMK